MPPAPKPPVKEKRPRKFLKKSRVKASNPKRRKSEFARCYHSRERVAWVKAQTCVIRLRGIYGYLNICKDYRTENVHIETGGTSRKADADKIVPMCSGHHHDLHNIGRESFERFHGVDLSLAAAETQKKWESYLNTQEKSA